MIKYHDYCSSPLIINQLYLAYAIILDLQTACQHYIVIRYAWFSVATQAQVQDKNAYFTNLPQAYAVQAQGSKFSLSLCLHFHFHSPCAV